MGRPPQSETRDTRQALIDAGLDIFSEKGYFGASLRDIAQAVGVRGSAIYHYFPSKEALFEAILESRRGPVAGAHLAERPVQDVRALLEELGRSIIARFSEPAEQKLFRILMSDGVRLATQGRINFHERAAAGAHFLGGLMARLVREGWLRDSSPDFLALEFFAPFMHWRQMQVINPAHPFVTDPEAFVRRHVDQFLFGAKSSKNPE